MPTAYSSKGSSCTSILQIDLQNKRNLDEFVSASWSETKSVNKFINEPQMLSLHV